METAIRWSPSSTLLDQRFLLIDVNGHSFRRCNVERYDGKNLQHETVSTYTKVPPFRAFDWASHDESLVAVGQWSGEVTVLRIDDAASNVSLPAKHQRLCNTVAFSRTGLLAAGLERVRNDFCLNIWDVNQRLPALSSPKPSPAKRFVEPYRSYASSEAISSIKFFSAQPEVLISGVKGRGIRIYDLRENTGNPSLQFQTSSVHNIAIDPLDENYFACAGVPKDTTIQIWDRRHGSPFSTLSFGSTADLSVPLGGPVLEYKEAFPTTKISPQPPLGDPTGVMVSSIWSLRYCKGKSGCLGALANNGDFKVFETKHEYSLLGSSQGAEPHGIDIHPDERDAEYDVPMADDRPILTKRVHQVENACDDDRKGRLKSERVVAFDFTNLAGSKGTPCVIVLRGDRSVGILELNGPAPALAVSPFSEIVVSKANKSNSNFHNFPRDEHFVTSTIQRIRPSEKARISNTTETELQSRLSGVPVRGEFATGTGKKPQSSREAHEQLIESHMSNGKLDIGEALACFNVAFRRCAEGYLLDCDKNIDLLPDDPWLQNMWRWIRRAKNNAADEGMTTDTLDLSFFGVASMMEQRSGKEVAAAVEILCERLSLPEFRIVESATPNHRRLCLHVCGLGLPDQQLKQTVNELVQNGENIKAAALAIIHDRAKLALDALRNGTASPAHRELSLAFAGYNKGITDDETWEQTIQDLKKGLDDPYGRAILALVSHGDWHDVLAELTLPLRDRVAIALMYLGDEELTHYINETAAECIKQGDIEGIVLTGLTEQGVPLFQNYIRKFSDIQTAVLAMSYTCPRYFTDPRVDLWRQTYRSYLNDWQMFIPRVHFDVQYTKLSKPPDSKPGLPPPPRQVSLRCNNCDQALHRKSSGSPHTGADNNSVTHPGSIFGDAKSGTVCPSCGRHMPRCVICMYWLGMPDPHSRGSVAADAEAVVAKEDNMSKFITVCRGCWHMSHSAHAQEWFYGRNGIDGLETAAGHDVCPVPDCQCRCKDVDVGVFEQTRRALAEEEMLPAKALAEANENTPME